jgi:hypothetical protein
LNFDALPFMTLLHSEGIKPRASTRGRKSLLIDWMWATRHAGSGRKAVFLEPRQLHKALHFLDFCKNSILRILRAVRRGATDEA